MTCEPTRLEMLLTRIAFFLGGKSVYQDFSDRLPLQGAEVGWDFGCGLGTVPIIQRKGFLKAIWFA